MKAIKEYLTRQFSEPVVYARIAELLRGGAEMVRVKYRNRIESRYYTGTGNVYYNGRGQRKRWMMEVHRFDQPKSSSTNYFINLGLPWCAGTELDLLLAWDFNNVISIEEIEFDEAAKETVKTEIANVIRRLKPGQGYHALNCSIQQDTIQPEGYLLRNNGSSWLIPEKYIGAQLGFVHFKQGQAFDPKKVYVADEAIIKRQHRPNTDLLRWLEVKQVPSVGDNWALSYTHALTAGAPVFYYSVDINIDNKAMKAYPFYITELVNMALKKISHTHGEGHYHLEQANITITWNGETKPLLSWIDHVRRHPTALDEQPHIIHKLIHPDAGRSYSGDRRFVEATDD